MSKKKKTTRDWIVATDTNTQTHTQRERERERKEGVGDKKVKKKPILARGIEDARVNNAWTKYMHA